MRILFLVVLLFAMALAEEPTRQKRQFIYTTGGFGYPSTSLNYGYTGYTALSYPSYSFASYPSYGLTYGGYPSTYAYGGFPTYGGLVFGK